MKKILFGLLISIFLLSTLFLWLPYISSYTGIGFNYLQNRTSENKPLITFMGQTSSTTLDYFTLNDQFEDGRIIVFPEYKKTITVSDDKLKLFTFTRLIDIKSNTPLSYNPGYYRDSKSSPDKPFFNFTFYNRDGSIISQEQILKKSYSRFGYKNGKWYMFTSQNVDNMGIVPLELKKQYEYFIELSGNPAIHISKLNMLDSPAKKYLLVEDYHLWKLNFEIDSNKYPVVLSTFRNPGDLVLFPLR